jgi:hypothetical protein
MMHPSELQDADWMPPRRPRQNFRKCLKQKRLEMELETSVADDAGRRIQHSGRNANTPTPCLRAENGVPDITDRKAEENILAQR